jgi:hypothetical protein
MKMSKLALLCAIAGALYAGSAFAVDGVRQPSSVQRVAFEYYAQDEGSASPSDAAPTPVADDAAPAPAMTGGGESCSSCGGAAGSCGCDSCDNGCGGSCFYDCCLGEPWKLFDNPCHECNHITIGGWFDQGFTWNTDDPSDRFNGPVTFNDRDSEYQLNQIYLYAEKATDTGGCGWDLGGRIDLLYGTDYRFTIAQGLDAHDDFTPKWNSDDRNFYGLAMPQAYGEVAYNDLKVKVGHFYTILGYEVVPSTGNFFYSHAYTMQYGEPFTHSGALAAWAPNKCVTFYGGVVRGWDNWEDPFDSHESLMGGVTFTSPDTNRSLAFAFVTGEEPIFTTGANTGNRNRYVQSIVYNHKLNDCWRYVIQSDYGHQDDAIALAAGRQDAEWYGLNTYLIRSISDCYSWGVRSEWFRDDDGFRVAPVGDFRGSNTASAGGFAGDFYEIAVGVNYKPNANWLIRPELRYDWYNGPNNGNGDQPFDNGSDDDQFLAAFDVITTF